MADSIFVSLLRFCLVLPFVFLAAHGGTQSKTLSFSIPANSTTTINLTSSSGIGNPALTLYPNETTASYNGSFEAEFEYDPVNLYPTSFSYTGGYMTVTEADPLMQILPALPYYSTPSLLPSSLVRTTNVISPYYLGFTPTTPSSPGSVDPLTGMISSAQHRRNANIGYERIIAARTNSVIKHESYIPAAPATLPHKGTAFLSLTELSGTTHDRTIRATLTYLFNDTDSYSLPLSPAQLLVVETGSWSTSKNFNAPTDFGLWSTAEGLGSPDPDSKNSSGVPLGFLHALDLPADSSSLPISVINLGSDSKVQIDLPLDGLRNNLTPQYSTTLQAGDWHPLPQVHFLDGFASLDKRATGSPQFSFPATGRCFIRFVALP